MMNFVSRDCLTLAALPHGVHRMRLQITLDARHSADAIDRKFAALTARGYIDDDGLLTTKGHDALVHPHAYADD